MTNWRIEFLEEAFEDFHSLDKSIKVQVAKAIYKLSRDPFAYGEPLGHKPGQNLTGLYKKKVSDRSIRVVYLAVDGVLKIVAIIVIDARTEGRVYEKAHQRLERYREALNMLKEAALSGNQELYDLISKRLGIRPFDEQ